MKAFKHKENGAVVEVDDNVAAAMERFGYEEIDTEKPTKDKKKNEKVE